MFEGCSSLIKINLSNLNSPNITSMIYTFTNCEQLETVNLHLLNLQMLKKWISYLVDVIV